jgi:carboxyl-terminal processing protease
METTALHRLTIDWPSFRTRVFDAARGAENVAATYDAIRLALELLDDNGHSFYRTHQGVVLRAPREPCTAPTAPRPVLPVDIGYIRIGSFTGGFDAGNAFAQAAHDSIRTHDERDLAGWIVDLRGNLGGAIWPMLAGAGPVLGEGLVGYSIFPGGEPRPWEYVAGAALAGGQTQAQAPDPYALRDATPPVAVLQDGRVASAGEAVAIAFRGRPGARSFGTRSCGLATGVVTRSLTNGADLGLAVAWMADRHSGIYEAGVTPDETFGDPAAAVQRAVDWLRSFPE